MIGQLDKQIIDILSLNSRITVTEIAEITNSSKSTVTRKIKNLEEAGVIKGYVSIIDDEASGVCCNGILLVKLTGKADEDYLLSVLEDMPQICTLFLMLGDYDLFLMVSACDIARFHMVVEEIRAIDGVESVVTSTIISKRKLLNIKIS